MKGLLVGLGSMGKNHARLLSIESHEIFLLDQALDLDQIYKFKFKDAFTKFEDAVSINKYDFAIIATPTRTHYEICSKLIKLGTHVLVEKPITESITTAVKLKNLARKHGVKVLPGHIERYNPAVRFLKDKLAKIDTNSIYRVEIVRASPFPPRINDIGVAFDLSVHDLDVINFLIGRKVTSVFCVKAQTIHNKHEDGIFVFMKLGNSINCIMNTNWTSPLKQRQIKIYGSWGMFCVDFISQSVTFFENPSHVATESSWGWAGISEGQQVKFNVPKIEPLKYEHSYFFEGLDDDYDFNDELNSSIDVIKTVTKFHESHRLKKVLKIG